MSVERALVAALVVLGAWCALVWTICGVLLALVAWASRRSR